MSDPLFYMLITGGVLVFIIFCLMRKAQRLELENQSLVTKNNTLTFRIMGLEKSNTDRGMAIVHLKETLKQYDEEFCGFKPEDMEVSECDGSKGVQSD